jgi:hypothetical protein
MIACSLELKDTEAIEDWSQFVPAQAESDPLSVYLLYRLMLVDARVDLGEGESNSVEDLLNVF